MAGTPEPSFKVAVGKRSALLLEALCTTLRQTGLVVVASGATPEELIADAVRLEAPPDVALVDASLDGDDPRMIFLGRVRRALGGPRIVLLAETQTPELAQAALDQEVEGVVLADATGAELADTLAHVAGGRAMFPAGWLGAVHRASHQSLFTRLSGRQVQVLELIAQGLTNREIAERLVLSNNTVKFHVREIYERLGVTNRVQAASLLAQTGASPAATGETTPKGGGAPPASARDSARAGA